MRGASWRLSLVLSSLFLPSSLAQYPPDIAFFKRNYKCVDLFFDQCSSCQNYATSARLSDACYCGFDANPPLQYMSRCVADGVDDTNSPDVSTAISLFSSYCDVYRSNHYEKIAAATTEDLPKSTDSLQSVEVVRAVPRAGSRPTGTLARPTACPSPPEFCERVFAIDDKVCPTMSAAFSQNAALRSSFMRNPVLHWSLFAKVPLVCLVVLLALQLCRGKALSTCVPASRSVISAWTNLVDTVLWQTTNRSREYSERQFECVRIRCRACYP